MYSKVTDSVYYIGTDDKTIDLFESQYVVPNGVSYNSYLIMDEKVAVMDTVDPRAEEAWFANLEEALGGRKPDYLVISHLEPDHAGNIQKAAEKYPDMKLVSNAKVFAFLPQFFDLDLTDRCVTVKEGDTLSLGSHTLAFVMAPMVHWPEVMGFPLNFRKVQPSISRFCFPRTASENSALWIRKRNGRMRRDAISSISSENTALRYRRF